MIRLKLADTFEVVKLVIYSVTGSRQIKKFIIENWLIKRNQPGNVSIIGAQIQQAGARILFAFAGLFYLQQHAVFFSQYQSAFLTTAAVYFTYNLLTIAAIKRRPLSAFRALFAPAFDIGIVCFAAIIDGGHSSGLYFMLLVIIFGNGFRYGNALLLYTQAMAILGLVTIAIFTLFNMHFDLDRALLVWQLGGLLVIPTYIYLIGEKAERAIQGQHEAEEASFSLLDQGPLPVFTYDLDKKNQPRVLYSNAAINEVFRDDYTRLIGEQPDMLALLEDGEEMLDFCRRTLLPPPSTKNHAEESKSIYIRGRDRKDNVLLLMCNTTRLRWRDQWIGVCFIVDITQREAMQAKLQSMHQHGYMSTMVAGIVHDFRNVLTTMIGYAEVMQMDPENLNKDQLQAIIDAGEHGSSIIGHLLTVTRGKEAIEYPHAPGDQLQKPLENILGLSRLQLPAHIQLHCHIQHPLPDVNCSILEIEQMLLNLTHNAAAAIRKEGQITVRIHGDKKHPLSQKGSPALCIEVSDNGTGIAPEDVENIFEPFWTSRKDEGGSGLGLAMVHRIVNQRHGIIKVNSKLGHGTTFTMHLPPYLTEKGTSDRNGQSPDTMPAVSKTGKVKSADAKHAESCRILLVDDAPDVLKIHQALLSRLNHVSTTAENGQKALDIFSQGAESFDLIITDFRMPVMNGLELVQQIRELGASIPIIMVTAFGEDEQLQQVENHQVHLLNKPVTLDRLQRCIDESVAEGTAS